MVRLFLAIDLPDLLKDNLYELQNSIKDTRSANVNWVFKKNLHLTLKFLGEIPADKVEEIKNKLRKIKINSFKLATTQLQTFPSLQDTIGKIAVIWVGVEPQAPVIELQKLIDIETINYGDLKFGAHITLGRVRSIKDKIKLLQKLKDIELKKIQFEVNSFNLYKSILRKEGPDYFVEEEYKLL